MSALLQVKELQSVKRMIELGYVVATRFKPRANTRIAWIYV
jgi:hypothetical protein